MSIIVVNGSMGSSMTLYNTWLAFRYYKEFGFKPEFQKSKLDDYMFLDFNMMAKELDKKAQ